MGGGVGLCNCRFVFYEHWPLPFNLSSHSSIPPLPPSYSSKDFEGSMDLSIFFSSLHNFGFLSLLYVFEMQFSSFWFSIYWTFTVWGYSDGTGNSMESKPQSLCWLRQWWEAMMEWIFESRAGARQVMSGCGCTWVKGISDKEGFAKLQSVLGSGEGQSVQKPTPSVYSPPHINTCKT